jgi:FkbM family methyltransferase
LSRKPITSVLRRIKRRWLYRTVQAGGRRYRVRRYWRLESPSAANDRREAWLNPLLRGVFELREGAFVDVGANVGQTLLKVLAIDESRAYVGVEPNPLCCSFVEDFVGVNKLRCHKVLPIGLSDEFAVVELAVREGTSVASSVVAGFRPQEFYSYAKPVFVAPGDFVAKNLGLDAIALIKVDVEGAELEVVRGFQKVMEKQTPFIIFEVLPNYLAITDTAIDEETLAFRAKRIREIETLFKERGYGIYKIVQGKGLTKVDRLEPGAGPETIDINYLAVPLADETSVAEVLNSQLAIGL